MPESSGTTWPTAELGPLRRLRVIASTARNPVCATRRFDVPPERLWEVVSDLERELPQLLPGVRSFTPEAGERPDDGAVGGAAGGRFRAVAVSRLGHRETFEVLLAPGWCLMQSRVLLGAMAAEPEDGGTRFGYLSAFRLPGGGALQALRRPGAGARSEALLDRLGARIAARRA
ncbi:SRPBCC family protein [Kitasatospora sp. NA04385]|uniref:SRPBCC family protein n=1 Tax=Kitasatospora sp. NA04385 TaxID=2742135 RepID=UPI00159100BA|nr:SRPBCC family protein [Kitasatospora sp. NA04385]QKW20209.1 SRPBCC family protein [Kitasatospora sp. NA04385]